MSLENSQFNAEKEKRKMPKEESEKMLNDMDDYINGLKIVLQEKEAEVNELQKNPEINSGTIKALNNDIKELEEQINGLEEFSELGKQDDSEIFSAE